MKVLLDECVPRQLKRDMTGYDVSTVTEMGWAGIKNGALLRLAETQFDAFVTVDRNLAHQQNLQAVKIGVIVVLVRGNKLSLLRPLMPEVLVALQTIRPGEVISVGP